MAEMFPRELLANEVKSNGERKVFEVLRDELAAPWQAYHSVSWIARDHAKGVIDGEIDFVLCHPEEGVLCLEVKGGNLDSRGGSWFTGPPGAQTQIRDPFTQALDHRYSLERHIVGASIAGAREWLIGQAIVLPDVTVHELALAPDAKRELIIDRIDLREVPAAIGRVIAYHRGSREQRRAPGLDGAAALRDLLVPTVTLRVPLAEEIMEEEVALIRLTGDQGMLLARMGRTPRLAITGCAGSGKTMLAVEHAKRLAEAGTNVLFVCFNKALQQHLRDRERTSGIDFYTFHGLCTHLAKRAAIKLPANDLPADYFERVLPEALLEAASELGPQYGALIVDEAQDLEVEWFETLLYLLEDEKKGNVWLFFDDNQRIFESGFSPGDDFLRFDLNVNCRNTQSIHREVIKHYGGSIVPEVQGPVGREIELHRTDDQPRAVASAIEQLCGEGEIPPQDVVVLSAHGVENSLVYKSMQSTYSLTRKRGELGNRVFFSSIRGFKGLESPVAILCELEDLDDTREQQLYVALSRARSHCVVVGREELRATAGRVVDDLNRTFPRLQLITTTHSPFVVQARGPQQLIDLNEASGVTDATVPKERADRGEVRPDHADYRVLGLEDIAEEALDVPNPQWSKAREEMTRTAERYYVLLRQADHADSRELALLRRQLTELTERFSDNPAFTAFLTAERASAGIDKPER